MTNSCWAVAGVVVAAHPRSPVPFSLLATLLARIEREIDQTCQGRSDETRRESGSSRKSKTRASIATAVSRPILNPGPTGEVSGAAEELEEQLLEVGAPPFADKTGQFDPAPVAMRRKEAGVIAAGTGRWISGRSDFLEGHFAPGAAIEHANPRDVLGE